MTAKELAITHFGKKIKIPFAWSGVDNGTVCGYHELMDRVIIGLNSKSGWKWKSDSDGFLMNGDYWSFLYVEKGDV